MWDCCCIKSKQINASWKYRHKGKKKEGEKKMGSILFLLLKYEEHVFFFFLKTTHLMLELQDAVCQFFLKTRVSFQVLNIKIIFHLM